MAQGPGLCARGRAQSGLARRRAARVCGGRRGPRARTNRDARVSARLLRRALRRRPVGHRGPGAGGCRAARRARGGRHHEAHGPEPRTRAPPAGRERGRTGAARPLGRGTMSPQGPAEGRDSSAPLARWGRLVYRGRWMVLALSALSLFAALWVIHVGGQLDPPDIPADTESGRARRLLEKELPGQPPSFSLIFSSRTQQALDPAFREEVERALAPLRRDPRVGSVRTAYDPPGPLPQPVPLVSRDGRRTLATVELRGNASGFASFEFSALPPDVYPSLRRLVHSDTLEIVALGNVALNHDFTDVARQDIG